MDSALPFNSVGEDVLGVIFAYLCTASQRMMRRVCGTWCSAVHELERCRLDRVERSLREYLQVQTPSCQLRYILAASTTVSFARRICAVIERSLSAIGCSRSDIECAELLPTAALGYFVLCAVPCASSPMELEALLRLAAATAADQSEAFDLEDLHVALCIGATMASTPAGVESAFVAVNHCFPIDAVHVHTLTTPSFARAVRAAMRHCISDATISALFFAIRNIVNGDPVNARPLYATDWMAEAVVRIVPHITTALSLEAVVTCVERCVAAIDSDESTIAPMDRLARKNAFAVPTVVRALCTAMEVSPSSVTTVGALCKVVCSLCSASPLDHHDGFGVSPASGARATRQNAFCIPEFTELVCRSQDDIQFSGGHRHSLCRALSSLTEGSDVDANARRDTFATPLVMATMANILPNRVDPFWRKDGELEELWLVAIENILGDCAAQRGSVVAVPQVVAQLSCLSGEGNARAQRLSKCLESFQMHDSGINAE